MTYIRKSVPKPASGSGAPSAKSGEVTVIYSDDILYFPGRDANGVKMVGNIVLKPNAKMYKMYATPSSQKATYSIEGEEDLKGFLPKFEAIHPGDTLEMAEFVQNSVDEGFIIIYGGSCGANSYRVLGTPCNPMKFKGDFADEKEATKFNLMFEQSQKDRKAPGLYYGSFSFGENTAVASSELDLLVANGNVYQLPTSTATETISVASLDLESGTVFTLIGGGGTDPWTLDAGVNVISAVHVTILLKDGTQWVALDKAVINLEFFDAGDTLYLKEVSRG